MWQVEHLAFNFVEIVVREKLADSYLADPELHELNGKRGCTLAVHTSVRVRNAWSFSATSSMPPKNS